MALQRRLVELLSAALLFSFTACGSTHDGSDAPPAPAPVQTAQDQTPATPVVQPNSWAHVRSDLRPNPDLTFGQLDNGMRYVWLDHPEPDQRSYLRLHVNVGSLAELESEQGMAHFLEHMGFNGSENFKAGELITWFQSKGMSFGAHVNASTGFDETIYMLNLPDSREQDLREALTVFRDYAVGLDLDSVEVEKEKGVIDGEQRERDSASFRVGIEALSKQFDGTRIPKRIPIGVQTVRDGFTAGSVRAFYERWYRPDNMVLVLVGDLDGLNPEPLFEDIMGSIPAPTQAKRPLPDRGTPSFKERFYALYDSELPVVNLSLSVQREYTPEEPTRANMVKDLPLSMARAMLNLRFSELAKKEDAPFVNAGVGSASALELIDGETLNVTADPENWEPALAAAEQELRRALKYGFQQAELDEVRANRLRSLDESVERAMTRSSGSLASEIVASVRGDFVLTDAATDRDVLRPAYEAVTVEAAHDAFVKAWERGRTSLTSTGGLDLGENGAGMLREALAKSRVVEVEPLAEREHLDFAYASTDEAPGAIDARSHIEDLDIHQVRFANGVLLNMKVTDFKERQILVSARLGEGQLALDPELVAIAMVAGFQMNNIGLGAHSADDLRRLTAGKQVGVNLQPDEDAFNLVGGTAPEDLLLQFELLAAFLSDPGWRDDGMGQVRQFIPLIYQQLSHTAQGPMLREYMPALHGGDMRFGLPDQDAVEAVTVPMIKAWAAPQFASAPLEISVVGDFEVDAVLDAAARTVGKLSARREARSHPENLVVNVVTGLHQRHSIETADERTLVRVDYPTTDGFDARLRRQLTMLGAIVGDRVRETIREELGESYSPGAGSTASSVFPGVGMLTINANAEPASADTVLEAALTIGDALAKEGVTQEELDRLREPQLKQVRDAQRQNSFWVQALQQSQSRPEQLDDMRRLERDYLDITAPQLSVLAAEYLARERASWVLVEPARVDG
ncbi:MAG: peptidase M16 [Planctomycetota bacterium]|nr:MAG: peptidase M16 [Planctomycetota bacterium]